MFLLPFAVAILLVVSGLLAASETALFALIRMEGTRETLPHLVRQAIDRLMLRPLESLIVLIGLNETVNVFAECLATSFLLFLLGAAGAYVSAPLMFVLVLVLADITPKTLALRFPAVAARISARPLLALTEIVHPLASVFAPIESPPRPEGVSESEYKELLRLGERHGQVEPGERELIDRVFAFGNRRVSEVMTPLARMFSLDVDTPPERVVQEVTRGHFSRVPVYRRGRDNIVGILHVKDLVGYRLENAPPRLERLIRPPYFVPARKPLSELLDEMRRERIQLALVVNEYGKLQGLATLEDLLEELFGEIRDEFDLEGPELSRVSENEWLVSGGIDVGKLREALGNGKLPAPDGGEQTLSTLLLRRLARVPRRGEKVPLGDFEAEVERVRGASIELVRLRR